MCVGGVMLVEAILQHIRIELHKESIDVGG